MAANLNIEVPRNGSYFQRWTFRDKLTGSPLDVTAWTFALHVKRAAGIQDGTLAAATFSDVDGPNGGVNVRLDGQALASLEGAQETIRLAYDFLARDEGGVITVQTRGQIILMPGVSQL